MKRRCHWLLLTGLLGPLSAYSGTYTNLVFPGVTLSIALSNSVIRVGTVNILDCRLATTNYPVGIDGGLDSDTGLVLTSSAGKPFILHRVTASLLEDTRFT